MVNLEKAFMLLILKQFDFLVIHQKTLSKDAWIRDPQIQRSFHIS